MFSVLDDIKDDLPNNKPHYLMGVGTPSDILGAVKRGIDMFDCVMPTRNGRNGQIFTSSGIININNGKYKNDHSLIDEEGWDLYSLNNPLDLESKKIEPTNFINTRDDEDLTVADIRDTDKIERIDLNTNSKYSKWVFAQGYENYNYPIDDKRAKQEKVVKDTLVNGIHVPKPYKTRFTLDMVSGNLQISNIGRIFGITLGSLNAPRLSIAFFRISIG